VILPYYFAFDFEAHGYGHPELASMLTYVYQKIGCFLSSGDETPGNCDK
jgi:hypothetical protein